VLAGRLAPGDLPATYAARADEWLARVFEGAVGGRGEGFSLVAVGGYGRRELCPGSDLDVTLLYHRRRKVNEIADRIWYSIWDGGIRLDHSVRTPKEAISVAREDQRALLGLLDGRVVAGDEGLAAGVLGELDEWWRARARELLPRLAAAGRARHEQFGEVAFLLEPDLKESAGGLRDIEALTLAARGVPALAPLLLPDALDAHRRLLLGARTALHARTGTHGDRMLLQEQDEIAPLLGFADADSLMAGIAAAGREVMWVTTDGWRRIESYLAGPLGRAGGRDVDLGGGVVLRDGEIAVAADAGGAGGLGDGQVLLGVAAAAAEYGVPIAAATLDRLSVAGVHPPDPWPGVLRRAFVSLLEFGAAAVPVLEVLDQWHLLEQLLPEWLGVRHRPQRNAYHRFTVDRHLLETAAQSALLIRSVRRPDLLLISALLHDIGKGQSGDHSDAGRAIAERVATRMGFPPSDVDTVARVVQQHLLLADTATRRDLEDPATVEAVARATGDRETVEILAALTEADSIATGSSAWSPWKAGLVSELAGRVDAYLAGAGLPATAPSNVPTESQLFLASAGRLAVSIDDDSVTVVAPDRPGLLSLVAGTLALQRLDILSAAALSDGRGMAIEVFEVASRRSDPLDAAVLRADLERALDGSLLLEARLADLEATYARGRRAAAARPAEVRVVIDETASTSATVIEVRAPDSRGLLHRLTQTLADTGLDVISAKVATMGHEVVDTFYVRSSGHVGSPGGSGRPPAARLDQLRASLVAAARGAFPSP
jgi:[protein-PII] uridylyltransferase